MPHHPPPPRLPVGQYLRKDQADDRALAVLALEIPCWVLEEEGLYALCVEPENEPAARRELALYEAERAAASEAAWQEYLEERPELAAPLEPAGMAQTGEQSEFTTGTMGATGATIFTAPPSATAARVSASPQKFPPSLFVFIWTMCLFFALQHFGGAAWEARGVADSAAILRGQLWRVVTALTLHADLGHLFANIASGLVFTWALRPVIGNGWTWLALILSGAAGNALNAVAHAHGGHFSIGASTAVFGALGVLVGWQVMAAIQKQRRLSRNAAKETPPAPGGEAPPNTENGSDPAPQAPLRGTAPFLPTPLPAAVISAPVSPPIRWREILLPLGAGLALLAYLGMGGGDALNPAEAARASERVDILAHGFGMFAGLVLGAIFSLTRLPARTSPRAQRWLAFAALLLPALAWGWAWAAPFL